MRFERNHGRGAFAALLCICLAIWSAMPSATHAPVLFETLQDHAEMIAEHGHSHGLEEDLYWAMHGHSHDTADHDHSQAVLNRGAWAAPARYANQAWRLGALPAGAAPKYPPDRPPRA